MSVLPEGAGKIRKLGATLFQGRLPENAEPQIRNAKAIRKRSGHGMGAMLYEGDAAK
jgi:hypothetical protein